MPFIKCFFTSKELFAKIYLAFSDNNTSVKKVTISKYNQGYNESVAFQSTKKNWAETLSNLFITTDVQLLCILS